jgi:amino acid adenylation domain-containing protein
MPHQTLTQVLDESARRWHDRAAVTIAGPAGEATLSYAQLHARAARVAAALARGGVRRGDRVAILLPKGVESIAALYGAMMAGAAYVPLDPFAPARRHVFILSNCDVRALVTGGAMAAALGEIAALGAPLDGLAAALLVDTDDAGAVTLPPGTRAITRAEIEADAPRDPLAAGADAGASDQDLAYILYTSGSTGDPKGVMISHRNALTFVEWAAREFALAPEDRVSNHAPLHFDLSVFDIFATHLAGACVFLVPDRAATFPIQIARFIAGNRITVWYSVPSILTALVTRTRLGDFDLSALRAVLFAGEVFPLKHLRALMQAVPHAAYYNLYGPTETNVCTFHRVEPLDPARTEPIPIGRAIDGIEVFAVDAAGRVVRPGETGELLVRGDCVARGYWGLPERSAAALVQNPRHADSHDLCYRTGDLVRMLPGGAYVYLSRLDTMVKIRGYRVEIGEVEAALLSHAGVREACVIIERDAREEPHLTALVVSTAPGAADERGLRAHCRERIPAYMVPTAFLFRDALPKTSTGKVDRVALAQGPHGC